MQAAGVPTVPGSDGLIADEKEAVEVADQVCALHVEVLHHHGALRKAAPHNHVTASSVTELVCIWACAAGSPKPGVAALLQPALHGAAACIPPAVCVQQE